MPLDLDDPTATALAIFRALSARRIEVALYGGLALAAYEELRETRDADFAVAGPTAGAMHFHPQPGLAGGPGSAAPSNCGWRGILPRSSLKGMRNRGILDRPTQPGLAREGSEAVPVAALR